MGGGSLGRDSRQTDPKRHTMTAPPQQIPGLDGSSPPPTTAAADRAKDRAVSGPSAADAHGSGSDNVTSLSRLCTQLGG